MFLALGKKTAMSGVSPSRITIKKKTAILKPQVPDNALSSPDHHVVRTYKIAERSVIRGFVRQEVTKKITPPYSSGGQKDHRIFDHITVIIGFLSFPR